MNSGTASSDNGSYVKPFACDGSAPCLHKCKPITDSHPLNSHLYPLVLSSFSQLSFETFSQNAQGRDFL